MCQYACNVTVCLSSINLFHLLFFTVAYIVYKAYIVRCPYIWKKFKQKVCTGVRLDERNYIKMKHNLIYESCLEKILEIFAFKRYMFQLSYFLIKSKNIVYLKIATHINMAIKWLHNHEFWYIVFCIPWFKEMYPSLICH